MVADEPPVVTSLEEALELLVAARADRVAAEARAAHALKQLAATERLGKVGSYDWDVGSGRLAWSDELFRIYGFEPGAFEPSYEAFLDRVVPEDRDRIVRVHREALDTGGAFEIEERITREDGAVRTLLTNGMVTTDAAGSPAGLHGVCRDVTDERRAHEDARQASHRFRTLVQASPDAIVVFSDEGTVVSVNPQAEALFGAQPETLVGMRMTDLVPQDTTDAGADPDEEQAGAAIPIAADTGSGPGARPDGTSAAGPIAGGSDREARRVDGSSMPVDVAVAPLGDGAFAAFLRDATDRRRAEQARRQFAEAQLRQRQALELNDNVVQRLVALLWDLDDTDALASVRTAAGRTLAAARQMMSDLLTDLPGEAASLVRSQPLTEHTPPAGVEAGDQAPQAPKDADGLRVLIADDAAELRALLRIRLRRVDGVHVVGEAADGREAVEQCERLRPDVVLLDLSMPELDGLQAAELIRARVPGTRIYALSGYPAASMERRALDAGADTYFEKSGRLDDVCDALAELAARTAGEADR